MPILRTDCPLHKRLRPECSGCLAASELIKRKRKRKLDALTAENKARRQRLAEQATEAKYRAMLAGLASRKTREMVRKIKLPDGSRFCPKHEALCFMRCDGRLVCHGCKLEAQQRAGAKRAAPEKKRQRKHDALLGPRYSIGSCLANFRFKRRKHARIR